MCWLLLPHPQSMAYLSNYRKFDQTRVLACMPDAVGGFDEIFRFRIHDVRHEGLWVPIIKREPRRLYLHHDAMAWQEGMADVGQANPIRQNFVRLDRRRLCRVLAITTAQNVRRQHLLIAAQFGMLRHFVRPDVDYLYHPVRIAAAGGGEQPREWLAGNAQGRFERLALIDQNIGPASGIALIIDQPFAPR